MNNNLGTKIKELRILNEMSQEELGKRIGVQRAAVNKYERGSVTNIPINTIEKIADIFGVSPTYLLGWVEPNETSLSIEVQIIQGVKTFFGEDAVDLLETYTDLSIVGKEKVLTYSNEMFKLYGQKC